MTQNPVPLWVIVRKHSLDTKKIYFGLDFVIFQGWDLNCGSRIDWIW